MTLISTAISLSQCVRQCCAYPDGIELVIVKHQHFEVYEIVACELNTRTEVLRTYLATRVLNRVAAQPNCTRTIKLSSMEVVLSVIAHLNILMEPTTTVITLKNVACIVKIDKPLGMVPVRCIWKHKSSRASVASRGVSFRFSALRICRRGRSRVRPVLAPLQEEDEWREELPCVKGVTLTRSCSLEFDTPRCTSGQELGMWARMKEVLEAAFSFHSGRVAPGSEGSIQ